MSLATIQEEAREILVEFSNGICYAAALGNREFLPLVDDLMRVDYLSGVIANSDEVISGKAIERLRHYKGKFSLTDLSTIGTVSNPSSPTENISDLIRSGSQIATIGANAIVFSAPLSTAAYTVNVWIIGTGESQYDLGTITKATTGFTVSDAVIVGTLYYQVIVIV